MLNMQKTEEETEDTNTAFDQLESLITVKKPNEDFFRKKSQTFHGLESLTKRTRPERSFVDSNGDDDNLSAMAEIEDLGFKINTNKVFMQNLLHTTRNSFNPIDQNAK